MWNYSQGTTRCIVVPLRLWNEASLGTEENKAPIYFFIAIIVSALQDTQAGLFNSATVL